jgi:hypothetical protein
VMLSSDDACKDVAAEANLVEWIEDLVFSHLGWDFVLACEDVNAGLVVVGGELWLSRDDWAWTLESGFAFDSQIQFHHLLPALAG